VSESKDVEMVNVQINGSWMKFPKGTRMIEACRQAEVEVPHYCYHPKLSSPGNCRMCLVQMGMPPRLAPDQEPEKDEHGHKVISWMPRPVIACANTIGEGMGIRTEGPLVEEVRKGVMEFLLINHPLDCPICDQAGECRLQEFSVEFGNGESRFRENKVKKPKNVDIGPRIRLDDERCIMCSRCIRFCQEIVEDDVLGFTDRGSHTVLTTHQGKELANNYSLNTADICPVGALTSNDFRFQMRVWFLKETKSLCTSCGRGCNTLISSRENEVHRQTPRENGEVNSTWMCDKGRLNFHYLNSESRLTDPMIRGDQGHRVASWSEVHQLSAACLKALDPGQIAMVVSARMTNEELFMAGRLAKALKIELIDIVARPQASDALLVSRDGNPNSNGAKLILGIDELGSKMNAIKAGIDRGEIKALLAFDENLLKAGFTEDILKKLTFLLSSHLLANPTADLAQVVLPSPGFAEKRGSMINVTGRLQRLNQATQPPGQVMDGWEVFRDLIQAISGSNGLYMIEDVFKLMAADIPALAELSLTKIGDEGVHIMDTGETVPLIERERERVAKGIIVG
jgi:NADH-quinone oxidoreductase subunit G